MRETAVAYARGVVGALIVGMPTLLTMEMWWGGFTIPPARILLLLGVNAGVLALLQHYSGLHPAKTPAGQLRSAIVALGIAIVVSTVMLLMLGVLRGDTVLRDAVAKVALQSVPLSIGASIASTHFDAHHAETESRRESGLFFQSLAMGVGGAMVLGFTVAATEEPMIVGEQLTWTQAVAIALASAVLVFGISYAIGKRRLKMDPFSRK